MPSNVDVRLTCSPFCTLVARWYFFYPFAITPPRDLCASSRDFEGPTRVLLHGCGDIISLGHTSLLNQTCAHAEAWASTPFKVVCCDTEPTIIARDLVYFQLLLNAVSSEKEVDHCLSPRDALVAWEGVYGYHTMVCSSLNRSLIS